MSARLCVIECMGKESVPNVQAVARFVREVIGCNCPAEVFRHVEIQRGSSAVKACSADCELRVGGRLLMVVTSEPWTWTKSSTGGNQALQMSRMPQYLGPGTKDRARKQTGAGKPSST